MGQVWSKADFDGMDEMGFDGGRGSCLAVTAQTIGFDKVWWTSDDVYDADLNVEPAFVSVDMETAEGREVFSSRSSATVYRVHIRAARFFLTPMVRSTSSTKTLTAEPTFTAVNIKSGQVLSQQ